MNDHDDRTWLDDMQDLGAWLLVWMVGFVLPWSLIVLAIRQCL